MIRIKPSSKVFACFHNRVAEILEDCGDYYIVMLSGQKFFVGKEHTERLS